MQRNTEKRFSSTSYHFTLFILVARGTIWNIHTFLALQPLKLHNATLVWYVSRVHHNGRDARVFLFKGTTLQYDVNHSASHNADHGHLMAELTTSNVFYISFFFFVSCKKRENVLYTYCWEYTILFIERFKRILFLYLK